MNINVIDFGAKAIEEFDSTTAFQHAIDTLAEHGGGCITVPAGKFYIDMVTMRDNIELHLENGAVLVSLLERVPENRDDYEEPSFNMKRYLIGGEKVNGAAITGFGTIDGRGYLNFWNKNDGYEHPLYGQRYWPLTHRPRALIHFRESTDIRIENITLLEPPAYNIWLLGCNRCDIKGIRIRTDLKGPNNDGLDIDCCSNIYITGCDIVTNDDAIGIFSDINTLGYDKTCENIVVSDCRIMAVSDAIRIGYVGDGAIRNVTINNCVIYNTMIGISMMVAISPDDCRGVYIKYGPKISQINISNLIIDSEETFNFQSPKSGSNKPLLGYIDDVYIHNITAVAKRGSFFGGVPERPLGRIEISNLNLTLTGEMGTDFEKFIPDPYPVWTDMTHSGIPYPFHIRYAEDLTVKDSHIRYKNASGAWQKKIFEAENAEVNFENVSLNGNISDFYTTEFEIDRNGTVPRFSAYTETESVNCADYTAAVMLPFAVEEKIVNKSMEDWQKFFADLKNNNVKNIILPSIVYPELYYCYYASSRYAPLYGSTVLEKLLACGKTYGMNIFCGSCFSTVPFRKKVSDALWEKELLEHRCCLSEIYRKHEISAFFIPLEVFKNVILPENFAEKALAVCKNFVGALQCRDDKRPILLNVSENIPIEIYEKILSEVKIDKLCISESSNMLSEYDEICRKYNIELIRFTRKEI